MINRLSRLRWVSKVAMIACGSCPITCYSQGLVTFGNGGPVYDVDGVTRLAGSEFLAELYAAAPGNSLQPISTSITPFLTGSNAGYFFNVHGDSAVPGTLPGGSAAVRVVAWRASDGATFADADHFGAHVGASQVFTVYGLGGIGPGVSPDMVGMPSFSLQVVPEPDVVCLGVLGMGSLLLRWRRRG